MSSCDSDEVMPLRGGVVVPTAAVVLALQLEAGGFTLEVQDGRLRISPALGLTPTLIARIRQHRDGLIAVTQYEPPPVC